MTGDEPPAYHCVGTSDGIASYQTMEERIRQIQAQGTDAEIEVFDGLPHGFGLGEGTAAEGWLVNGGLIQAGRDHINGNAYILPWRSRMKT